MLKVLQTAALLVFATTAAAESAESVEAWKCYATDDYDKEQVLVKLTAKTGGTLKTGYVEVAGTRHFAFYKVKGLNRRWNFGEIRDDLSWPFAFVIEPDGDATYYEFGSRNRASPIQFYKCEQD